MFKDFLHHFRFSAIITIIAVGLTMYFLGADVVLTLITLVLIELTFSFDNAIMNAKTVATLSPFWRKLFLSVGIIIAVFGTRLLLPIFLIVLTSHTGFMETVNLALNNPVEYADKVEIAHPAISSFGGTFLLLIALVFFMTDRDRPLWLKHIERPLKRFGNFWIAIATVVVVALVVAFLPADEHKTEILTWGGVAVVIFLLLHGLTTLLPKLMERPGKKKQTGLLTGTAAFFSFVYLEVLDASFSLDGVLGAFAVASDVLLIAAGLGIGAIWVRSLTVYMVDKKLLKSFAYIEHGAHYAMLLLAISLFVSLFIEVPSWIVGGSGLVVIGLSLLASQAVRRRRTA